MIMLLLISAIMAASIIVTTAVVEHNHDRLDYNPVKVSVLVGSGFILNMTISNEDATVDDLIDLVNIELQHKVVSHRTAVAELRLNGASLFREDAILSIVTSNEDILTAVWGYKFIIHPPEMCVGEPLILNVYHDTPNSLLVDACKMTHPWTNCPEITDIRIVHERQSDDGLAAGVLPSYPTLMERDDWTINQMLNENDQWKLIASVRTVN